MLSNPSSGRRTAGRLMVLATVAVALPLTATRAINYIDVPAAKPEESATAPIAAAAFQAASVPARAAEPAEPATAADAALPSSPTQPLNIRRDGNPIINGQAKQWRDLTPAEKAEVRRSIAQTKQELARNQVDREKIRRDIREAMAEARIDQDELRRDLAEARADIDRAVREVDAHAIDIRRSGQDPEQLKATIRASMKSVEAIDIDEITRKALASVDRAAIEASISSAVETMAKAEAEMDQLEQRLEQDE